MIIRPGWIRINFNYFIIEETFQYIVQAMDMMASHGWRLLPNYQFESTSAIWRYQSREVAVAASLDEFDVNSESVEHAGQQAIYLQETLLAAKQEMLRARNNESTYELEFTAEYEAVRWFTLPLEVVQPSGQAANLH